MSMEAAVLVVEDDVMVRDVICDILKGSGFRATGCATGEEALSLARRSCYDAVIIDHYLPARTGTETTRDLRAGCPDSVIIGISGSYHGKDFRDAGGDLFLHKPVDVIDLVKHLEVLMDLRKKGS